MSPAERLSRALEELQTSRAGFLQAFHGLPDPQLHWKPPDNGWSAGEVAHHVGLTERVLVGYLRELFQAGTPEQGAHRRLRFEELPMGPRAISPALLSLPPILLPFSIMSSFMPQSLQKAMLATPFVKVKTAPLVEPTAGIPGEQLLSLLSEVRRGTLDLLEPVAAWDLSRFRWTHPLMGTHDVYATLELLASHDHRHRKQIERVRSAAGFPAA